VRGRYLFALLLIPAGCDLSTQPDSDQANVAAYSLPERSAKAVECDVGSEVEYFVPGATSDHPALIIGCAELSQTGSPVEFSANGERFRGSLDTCINPAYEKGQYIPATCTSSALSRLEVFEGGRRRIPGKPDGYVTWGTAPADSAVFLATSEGETEAITFSVPGKVATRVGASSPFAVFVAELPVEAACENVIARTDDGDSEKVPGGRSVCPETKDK
jgi:hypothetical protein